MKMTYFVLGTNDMPRSIAFYDAFFEGSGVNRIYSEGRMTLWKGDDFMFAVAEPWDGQPATHGNGTMVGFELGSAAEVERLHAKALAMGGTDEGEPGMRSGRFAAYVRDLDSNKLCLFE